MDNLYVQCVKDWSTAGSNAVSLWLDTIRFDITKYSVTTATTLTTTSQPPHPPPHLLRLPPPLPVEAINHSFS
ncbi:MAG: hypothetical protein ACFFBD_27970 [Candidatus Hodarchaeota archaeon]